MKKNTRPTPGEWTVGYYTPTPRFQALPEHVAVCRRDGSLVAVTGPAGDAESESDARLFAAAPALLAVVERFRDLYFCPDSTRRRKAEEQTFALALAALAQAQYEEVE